MMQNNNAYEIHAPFEVINKEFNRLHFKKVKCFCYELFMTVCHRAI